MSNTCFSYTTYRAVIMQVDCMAVDDGNGYRYCHQASELITWLLMIVAATDTVIICKKT